MTPGSATDRALAVLLFSVSAVLSLFALRLVLGLVFAVVEWFA